MTLSRRELLTRSAAGAGVLAVGNLSTLLVASPAYAKSGVGDPVSDPAGILDLPEGFSYSIVSRAGDPLPGGGITPGRHDGTATFNGPAHGVVLVQNHENGTSGSNPALAAPELTYDPAGLGGTTTLTLDRFNGRVDEYVSLAGTISNCAGGVTPWETWLTCEETETKTGSSGATKDHGFVFEVDPHIPSNNTTPTPLVALGRFAHEATVIDPRRGDVYLTEDASNPNGLVYRMSPNDTSRSYGALRNGGTLHAMSCSQNGTHVADLSVYNERGTTLQVGWIVVPDPMAAILSTRKQFADSDVTRSRKFEGMWWGKVPGKGGDGAHIVCSFARISDGSHAEHDGQVWVYDPHRQTLTLELFLPVNPDASTDQPDGPDNITISPYGGFFLAEDGRGVQHLLSVDKDGTVAVFARNHIGESEFTGVTFSPDGDTLFANIQDEGLCFAITGPFNKLA